MLASGLDKLWDSGYNEGEIQRGESMGDGVYRKDGAEHICGLIAAAVADGSRVATVRGDWEIDSAVRIPSDFTLLLDGCHLRQADGCYDNIFVNEHSNTPAGRTVAGTDRNIRVLGKNGAVLDGGVYNGLSEKNQLTDGRPAIWKNNLLLFSNVDGFEVGGFACRNQRWWAVNFLYCAHGHIHDLDFKACDIWVDEEGNHHHGLHTCSYMSIYVKNADGVDLRQGCHHILVENITGFTEDDTVAMTGLNGRIEHPFIVEGLSPDIAHVTVRNVAAAAYCTNVRLLNQGGIKLHDILVENVEDTSADCPYMNKGLYGVRVGDVHLYDSRHATAEETYNITIRGVRSRASCAVCLAGDMGNLVLEDVTPFDGARMLEDKRGQ